MNWVLNPASLVYSLLKTWNIYSTVFLISSYFQHLLHVFKLEDFAFFSTEKIKTIVWRFLSVHLQTWVSTPPIQTPFLTWTKNPFYCHLQIGTWHLPLQGSNYEPLQLLNFNTPWKEFRVKMRNEALCALEKTGRPGLQIVRYFWEKILWALLLHLPITRKTLKSFAVMSTPRD